MSRVRDPAELIVVAVIVGLFAAMVAGGWYAAKARRARLARLREAPVISVEHVSEARILMVVMAGVVVTGVSAPLVMAAFPTTPLMFLVCVGLAFAAVLAPLTFARRLTVDVRMVLEPLQLRLERRGVRAVVLDLGRPFTLQAERIDSEVLVLLEQEGVRVPFSYQEGPAFVTLPLSLPPEGWIREGESVTFFGEEAAVIHARLRALGQPSAH